LIIRPPAYKYFTGFFHYNTPALKIPAKIRPDGMFFRFSNSANGERVGAAVPVFLLSVFPYRSLRLREVYSVMCRGVFEFGFYSRRQRNACSPCRFFFFVFDFAGDFDRRAA